MHAIARSAFLTLWGSFWLSASCGESSQPASNRPASSGSAQADASPSGGGGTGGSSSPDGGPGGSGGSVGQADAAVNSRYAGQWTGTWGTGRLGLSFVVTDQGTIRDFMLTNSVIGAGCGTGALHEVKSAGLYAIRNGGVFEFDIGIKIPNACGSDGACSGADLTGMFTSDGTASGDWEESILNRQSLCFGGGSRIAWKAAKECSVRPEMGVSRDRFCGPALGVPGGFPPPEPVACGPSHREAVNSIALSADGKLLVSGSGDRSIKVWSLPDRAQLRTLSGHTSTVNSVALTPDGKIVVSASVDKSVRLWSVLEGTSLLTLTEHTDSVTQVAISPDGTILASASDDKTVKLWSLPAGAPLL